MTLIKEKEVIREIVKHISKKRLALFVGAGVTISASDGNPVASWTGLLKSGIRHCYESGLMCDDEKELLGQLLNKQTTEGMLAVAEEVAKKLGYETSSAFVNWMNLAFENLLIMESTLIESLGGLKLPFFTTNYDLFIEKTLGLESRDMHLESLRQLLSGEENHVVHLHGYLGKPDSIVFSKKGYDKHSTNEKKLFGQKVISASRGLLFVGCGNGMDDPNLTPWMSWDRELLGELDVPHFRLVTVKERKAIGPATGRQIKDVVYGVYYSDLNSFIQRITKYVTEYRLSEKQGGHKKVKLDLNTLDSVKPDLPSDIQFNAYYEAGEREYSQSEFAKAIEFYSAAIDQCDNKITRIKLAQCWSRVGEPKKALNIVSEILAEDRHNLPALCTKAEIYSYDRKHKEQLEVAEKLISLWRKNVIGWSYYSAALLAMRDYPTIVNTMRPALKEFPKAKMIRVHVGQSLCFMEKFEEALLVFEEVLKLEEEHLYALDGKARVLRDTSKVLEAIEICKKVVTIDPEYSDGWSGLGIAYKMNGDYSDSLNCFKTAQKLSPLEGIPLSNEGYLYIKMGKYGPAKKIFSDVIEMFPDLSDGYFGYGITIANWKYTKAKKKKKKVVRYKSSEEIEYIKKAIDLEPSRVFYLKELLKIYTMIGNKKGVEEIQFQIDSIQTI